MQTKARFLSQKVNILWACGESRVPGGKLANFCFYLRHGGCHCPVPFTGDFCEITQLDINAALDKEIVATKGRIDSKELSLIIVIVAVAITVFIWLRRYLRARRARWMRGDDIVINLQSFRDEDGRGGGISANGNSLFPGMVVGSFD